MTDDEFRSLVSPVADLERTCAALEGLRRIQAEQLRQAREILAAHASQMERGTIRRLIQRCVQWQQVEWMEAMATLQEGMNNDFEALVGALGGGRMFLPDQAWENFVAPVKDIVEALDAELTPALQAVGEIEDQYLFL